MKIFLSTFGTESNTFATYPTSLANFRRGRWSDNGIENAAAGPWSGPAKLWHAQATARGWTICQSIHTFTEPAGTVSRAAYEEIRDRILNDLREGGPVDAVMLFLHGAMVADGYDDCEGDLVTRMRQIVGPTTKIGIELDLHAHMDHVLLDASDLIVIYKAYPHIDYNDRAQELFELMERTLSGEIQPKMALFDCRSMGLFPTTPEGPMKKFVADMMAAEGRNGILSLSLNHGFPWADVPLAGAKMLAVADGDPSIADAAAEEFGRYFYRIRKDASLKFTSMGKAMEIAGAPRDKPLLLADVSDQSGAGAPGDTNHLVRALLDANISNAVFGPIWDPAAVDICFQLGIGTRSRLRIGGKFEPHSGLPLDLDAEVVFLKRDAFQESDKKENMSIGDIAVIKSAGVEIVLSSIRTNVYSPSFFLNHGVTLGDKAVIGVKNLYKHTDIFAPLVSEQLYVATPGLCQPDFDTLDFKRLPRPMWPFEDDPLNCDP
ncbi:MAG: M81 family metallopeptidase [Rhodobacteraceae bacterium]|nr:M81 family metallopeptidase [Paracoccaceae bacterium]